MIRSYQGEFSEGKGDLPIRDVKVCCLSKSVVSVGGKRKGTIREKEKNRASPLSTGRWRKKEGSMKIRRNVQKGEDLRFPSAKEGGVSDQKERKETHRVS